ncbi:MAG: alpha-L-fucosidase [Candidatus Hydrogenedentota bacterium]
MPRAAKYLLIISSLTLCLFSFAGESDESVSRNKPERLEWFQDLGLGMFIHWGVDSQLGSVISHSMVGASDAYLDRFIEELPRTFEPKEFDPAAWARVARIARIRYVVFTTKHHSGFCMFETETTDFNVMNTPYGRDVTREVVDAFRVEGIAVGFYFSPDDFWMLYRQGHAVSRRRPEANPRNNPELMEHNLKQLRELLTNYGPIDVLFIDGVPTKLADLAWDLQPDIVITRGAMETPEQKIPGKPVKGPWEACFTMGTQWQFKPTNETYKSGTTLIEMLIETRAKGGNLLLNVGPTPDGEIPFEQERRLRELALWNFINGEAVFNTRPWHSTHHENIWFTRNMENGALYAILTGLDWKWGERKTVAVPGLRSVPETRVDVLGQSGEVLEYQPDVDASTTWENAETGISVSVMRAQRIYNDRTWPNPLVLRIRGAERIE